MLDTKVTVAKEGGEIGLERREECMIGGQIKGRKEVRVNVMDENLMEGTRT